jgi:hypothetical protein
MTDSSTASTAVNTLVPVTSDAGTVLVEGNVTTVPPSPDVERQLVNPRAVRRHHNPLDLVSLAAQVQTADQFVRATTGGKLQVIVDQIRFLQEQARCILEDGRRDAQLHHAACNFQKVPGHTYHLYEREDGTSYFSMLGPKEWGKTGPAHQFLGSYRLEHDRSWTPADVVEQRSRDIAAIDRVIKSQNALDCIAHGSS